MVNIELLKDLGYFKTKTLKAGEVLFYEGEKDNNLYILLEGRLLVGKCVSKVKKEFKILADIKKGEIFGESSISIDSAKESKIIADIESILLYIETDLFLNDFIEKYQKEGVSILKEIIKITNNRLNEANYIIASNYKINKEINNLKEINNKNILLLLQSINLLLETSYIVFFEVNPILKNLMILKFDTRKKDKMFDTTMSKIEIYNYIGNIKDFYTSSIYIQSISIGNDLLAKMVFIKTNGNISRGTIKVISSIENGIAGLLKQKNIMEEEKNKQKIEDYF